MQLHKILFPILQKRQDLPEDELNRYVLMYAVALIATSVHVMFAVFFLAVGSTILSVSHGIGILVFIAACFLLARRKYDIAGAIIAAMIIFSTLATITTIGGASYSIMYQVVTLIMMMVVPFTNRAIPITFRILIPVLMVGSYLYGYYVPALCSIGAANTVLAVVNLFVCSVGIVILLSLEKLVRNFVDGFRQQRMELLQDQAYTDPLTQLRNRRFADDYFAALAADPPQTPVCIAIADLDNYKYVNDTYGHGAGDTTLKMVSDIFSASTRRSDLVARWGGEEFLLVLRDACTENARQILDKIRMKVEEQEVVHERYRFNITVTIGVAVLDPADVTGSLEVCDQKMYIGKKNGKNQVVI